MQPGLVDVTDLQPERIGHAVVIDADRPAEVNRQPVDIAALQPGILERRLERDGAERELALRQEAAERADPNPDDRRLIAYVEDHAD